ncbi:YchF/TatD family DNA exonuclease [Methanothermococcus sp. SCGC AD-155-E23]|nr:YchF/TatD family DNA exonuclease [Methanothermococcus sp. SCGC AD-155-E23]
MDRGYIDAHCHLEDKRFNRDREEVIKACRERGIEVVTSGVGIGGCRRALEIKRKYRDIHLTLGFHPHSVRADDRVVEEVCNIIRESERDIVAVGEVGLDIRDENLPRQKAIFQRFISLAEELDKPLVIHGRGLERECYNMVNNRVISMFHCYSGDERLARELIENGHYVSISTLVCISPHHRELVKNLDLENILVETDSPYLSPVRGERNTPLNVVRVVEEIYRIKREEGYTYKEVVKSLYNNAKSFFNI